MDRGVFVALSGALIQEKRIDSLTENLANVKTPGFKNQKPTFEDALPALSGVRNYAKTREIVTDMSQGNTEKTDRPLDLALNGNGFFVVKTPNGDRYTRNGSFTVAKGGSLVTNDGYQVYGEKGLIKLNSQAQVEIDSAGNIKQGEGIVAKLKVTGLQDQQKLGREGNYYAAADGNREIPGNAAVEQGFLEVSNVSPVKAMTTMIEAMRSYETHAKMIQTLDDITKKATDEIGRVG